MPAIVTDNRAYCYAQLAVSSLRPSSVLIAPTDEGVPGWVGLGAWPTRCARETVISEHSRLDVHESLSQADSKLFGDN